MNIMKKRNIFLGLVLMLGLTGCYDLDNKPLYLSQSNNPNAL